MLLYYKILKDISVKIVKFGTSLTENKGEM